MECPFHSGADMIDDFKTGDMICRDCGLVVGDRVVNFEYSITTYPPTFPIIFLVEELAMKVHAPEWVGQAGQEMFDELGGKSDALAAACLFAACRRAGVPRTFQEIQAVSGVSQREISQAFKRVQARFDTGRANQQPKLYVNRFCALLQLPFRVVKTAEMLSDEVYMKISNAPASIAAACIRMASDNVKLDDLARVSGVFPASIAKTIKEIKALTE